MSRSVTSKFQLVEAIEVACHVTLEMVGGDARFLCSDNHHHHNKRMMMMIVTAEKTRVTADRLKCYRG